MNKKFLSLLILGLVISLPTFTAAEGGSSDDELHASLHPSLMQAIGESEVDWNSVFSQIGLPQKGQDAQTELTSASERKKKKRNKRGTGADVVSVDEYYASLLGEINEIEKTETTLNTLLEKYRGVIVPLQKQKNSASKKKPLPQDSKNKLKAYEKAKAKIYQILKELSSASGQKKIAEMRVGKEALVMEKIKQEQAASALRKEEEEKKRKRKKEEEKALANTGGASAPKLSPTIVRKMMEMRKHTEGPVKRFPTEFEKNQVSPCENDIIQLFWLFIGDTKECEVKACPVCGTVKSTPCKIKRSTMPPDISEHDLKLTKTLLESIITGAKQDVSNNITVVFPTLHEPKAPPIYNLFLALVKKAQTESASGDVTARSIGKLAFRFSELLQAPFEHVISDKSAVSAEARALSHTAFEQDTAEEEIDSLASLRTSLFSASNLTSKIVRPMREEAISTFLTRLEQFANQISTEDTAKILHSFMHDMTQTTTPIEVNWCPACLKYHKEKVKVQTSSGTRQDRLRVDYLHELIKQKKEIIPAAFCFLNILSYVNWNHVE